MEQLQFASINDSGVCSHHKVMILGPRLVCSVLVNSDILIANYGVKQNQFIKPTLEPPR